MCRQGGLSEDDWWDLHSSTHLRSHQLRGDAALPRKLLRLGVRYADGRKATTSEQRPRGPQARDDPPAGPLLSYQPGKSGMHGAAIAAAASRSASYWPETGSGKAKLPSGDAENGRATRTASGLSGP